MMDGLDTIDYSRVILGKLASKKNDLLWYI